MENELSNCYFQSNWEMGGSIDQNDPFESALSSMVSSPSNGRDVIPGDGIMIRELIGRLGSICDDNSSSNNSCYSTPLNSPPKRFNLSPLSSMQSDFPKYPPNLPSLSSDHGFVERATKFSSFGNNNFVGGEMGIKKCGKLSRVSSNLQIDVKKLGGVSISTIENGEIGDSREQSSVSELNPVHVLIDAKSRKRKSNPEVNAAKNEKQVEKKNEESNGKRSKTEDEEGKKGNVGENNSKGIQKNSKNENDDKEASKTEPLKDYIHVRARRGQATDSHSLAERVRREKISERMKFLQDLVPGCNKVTGKATVLDEIINYVQSLQRQVEFLSMKLATVNPRIDFNVEALLSSKDMFSSRGSSSMTQTMYQLDENSAQGFPLGFHQSSQQMQIPSLTNGLPNGTENPFSLNSLNLTGIRRNPSLQLPSIDGFGDSMMAQLANFWEDDLQSIVQMGIAQDHTQSIHGNLPNAQMKAEL